MNKNLLIILTLIFFSPAIYAIQKNYFSAIRYDKSGEIPVFKDAAYYDSLNGRKFFWELSFEEWFYGPHAFTALGGARSSIEDHGIVPIVSYIGNFAGNPVGGYSRGIANSSSVHMELGIQLGKLTKIPELSGWSIGNIWVWRFGTSLTDDYIKNNFNVQQNYGTSTIELSSLFALYHKDFSGDDYSFMLKFGRFDAGDNFASKPIYWLYQNNAFDGNPVGIFRQTKWSAYPGTTWGAMVQLEHKEGLYFGVGVFQITSEEQDDKHGLDFSFDGLGVNLTYELGWNINHDASGKSPGNISIGAAFDWYDAPHNDNHLLYSTFNCALYAQVDYMVYNMGFIKDASPEYISRGEDAWRDLRGLVAWSVFVFDPYDNLSTMPIFVSGGFLFNAPFLSRADDVICFGAAYGKYSDKIQTSQRNSYEVAFELSYKFQINRFSFIQPNLQYILNTNGGMYPDAFVIGLQYGLNL